MQFQTNQEAKTPTAQAQQPSLQFVILLFYGVKRLIISDFEID